MKKSKNCLARKNVAHFKKDVNRKKKEAAAWGGRNRRPPLLGDFIKPTDKIAPIVAHFPSIVNTSFNPAKGNFI